MIGNKIADFFQKVLLSDDCKNKDFLPNQKPININDAVCIYLPERHAKICAFVNPSVKFTFANSQKEYLVWAIAEQQA